MSSTSTVDVLGILGKDSPEFGEVQAARTAAFADADVRRRATQAVHSLPAGVRRGVALYVIGREGDAAASLSGVTARIARLVRARCLISTGRAAEAVRCLGDVASDPEAAALAAEAHSDLGDGDAVEAAVAAARGLAVSETRHLEALLAEISGEREAAMKAWDSAIAADPTNVRALFRRARFESLHGCDDEAIELYRRCTALPGAPVNAYLNLGNLYEDRGEFSRARECYRAVIDADPTNLRARLFDRDAAAALSMFYDEDMERRSDKRAQILRLPVTDFELSVRSRNCLAKMGVRSLGDLVQKTEAELLSYKNFGETSLQEIKDVLAQKGLRLGMSREEIASEAAEARSILEGIGSDADRRKILQKPLTELELSVRSRHCMNVLGLKTVADLCSKSEAELMTIKNFGQTSLNEVKQKLAELGLSLAQSAPPPVGAAVVPPTA